MAASGWRPQLDALAARHRCVAIDNRGVGRSEGDTSALTVDLLARDALAVVDALGLDGMHVVGHSLGGVIAQRFARVARSRTRSLALLCTFSGGRDLARPSARLIWLGTLSRLGTRAMRRRAFVRMVMPEAVIAARGIDALADELEALFGRSLAAPSPVADAQLRALRAHDEREALAELAGIPTYVASGAHDPIAEPRFGRALAAAIPGAVYREFAEASHALPIQLADAINADLAAHVSR